MLWRVPQRVPRWFVLSAIGGAALLMVTGLLVTWRLVISPSAVVAHEVGPADAVVMFVGGRGERLETALELINQGAADVLVIPNGAVATWPRADRLCGDPQSFEVFCPIPDPDTTRGEARAIGRLAEERGWESVVMVTSEFHISRARLNLERCFSGDITAVGADAGLSAFEWLSHTGHELLGHLEAQVLNRSC